MDESRKQFEEWFKKEVFLLRPTPTLVDGYWAAWQASRAAIEIELPKRIGSKSSWQEGPHMFADDVVSAIRAAGIKVKE